VVTVRQIRKLRYKAGNVFHKVTHQANYTAEKTTHIFCSCPPIRLSTQNTHLT